MNFTNYIFEFSSEFNKTSVIFENEISYKEIFENVNKIASLIKSKKLCKEEAILLVSDNSNFFIENYFGIIKSGVICVPINPALSSNEIKYIMDSLNIKIVFTQNKYLAKIHELICDDVEIFMENSNYNLNDTYRFAYNEDTNTKEDVAVILFTSGSTGSPKGVMLTHHNLIHNTNSIIDYLKLTVEDRIEMVLPFYYCYGTSILHTHFRVGASIVINNKFMLCIRL